MNAEAPRLDTLTPNALLILAAIDALSRSGESSPKSDEVGLVAARRDGAWVHRHGAALEEMGLATLSPNGHCFLSGEHARTLAASLRSDPPAREPPETCGWGCGCVKLGPCVAGRQLYVCGAVKQWCPDHVPGMPKAEISPRSRKAQHDGVWFAAAPCSVWLAGHGLAAGSSTTSDGTELRGGEPVLANRGSVARSVFGESEGTVIASAGGVTLVSWPPAPGRPAVEADIMRSCHLVMPWATDDTGLSEYQRKVLAAWREGRAAFARSDDGSWTGVMDGRTVNRTTVEILVGRGLVDNRNAAGPETADSDAPGPAAFR